MKRQVHWIAAFALLLGLGAMLPEPAAAGIFDDIDACSAALMGCLNDSWDTSGFWRLVADLRCGIGYGGCVLEALIF